MMNSEIIEIIRWLGLGSLAVALFAVAVVIQLHRSSESTSISAYLASNTRTFYTMGVVLSICTTAYYVYVLGWLGPLYDVSMLVLVPSVIGFVTGVAAVFIQIKLNRRGVGHYLHVGTAGISGLMLPTVISIVLVAGRGVGVFSIVSGMITAVFAISFLIAYIMSKRLRSNVFVTEVLYVALFSATITALTLKI